MSCKAYKEMLHSYVNNELNEIQHSAISEHIKSCAACSSELTDIRSLKQMLGTLKLEDFQLGEMKHNIMAVIQANKKSIPAYNIKVLTKLGASMIACGLIALVLNFTSLGAALTQYTAQLSLDLESTGQKINQPLAFINKGFSNMSDIIVNLDGMMFKIEQTIKGGM